MKTYKLEKVFQCVLTFSVFAVCIVLSAWSAAYAKAPESNDAAYYTMAVANFVTALVSLKVLYGLVKRLFSNERDPLDAFACEGLTKIVFSVLMTIAAPVTAYAITNKENIHEDARIEASWRAYCDKYDVDIYEPTEEEYNDFLDCWSGSDEEDAAMLQMSWDKFAESYVIDKLNPTFEEVQDFQNVWRGSAREEFAFMQMVDTKEKFSPIQFAKK